MLARASDTADQSVISLADSASNFGDHVGDEFDEVETIEITVLKFPKNLPIPFCPEGIDRESWAKAFQEATVYLIGTAHFR
ncbi:hypothetical protein NECAME_17949 [Necator americanus]|uniref:Uncharacterized protein n=1 Tax=Necator americanus TaxID=51031 RepID=W2TJ39_NECAM|nr:hypothetical protein NECAME_17949 [Necator americanus]ETN81042.1 hypothetical protein NECAME_17949 [Necator americanus]